eukprot:10836297-Alexandrium_andersonii.AAC.1
MQRLRRGFPSALLHDLAGNAFNGQCAAVAMLALFAAAAVVFAGQGAVDAPETPAASSAPPAGLRSGAAHCSARKLELRGKRWAPYGGRRPLRLLRALSAPRLDLRVTR